ncbi:MULTISPECIES: 13E12 repeat family protein [unclassified Mycobacterium]|uniref:13E12 repeat family protein n=1 Tax=unclassified Mycobacterium TaxID=2642494 RepID=UPI000801DBC6|nr:MULTISPECIES: 13E12 repeat family protein [unclassified Mycobacterium]OBH00348.1 HNH nuclease [Mycobacterium sp. E2699]OBI48746.1 HNH nuclease [Mycobacterium sp. E787]
MGVSAEVARERIGAALDAIDAAHDVLRQTSSDLVGNEFRVEVAERLETQERTNRGLMYRVFGEIAEPPDGAESAPAVRARLCARLRITPGELRRRFKLAARIRPRRSLSGPPLPPELTEVAAAVAAGALGEDHIRAICQALDLLPAAVSPTDVTEAERTLVAHARKLDSGVLTRLGQRIADYLNPDGLFTDEDRARRRGLRLGPQGPDGMSRLSGLLDPEARAYLEALEAAVRPGRHQPDNAPPEQPDTRTAAQRCHDALKLGLKIAIDSGKLGTHRGHPVTVIVTTTLAELNQAAHAAADSSIPMPPPARTGGGSRLPMRDLIRLATHAIHYLAVFDDHTNRPLYLGRQKRIATADQRLICYARDRGCTRPHCLIPGYRSEVHHAPDWAAGGRTDADKLFFACDNDHDAATRGDYHTEVTDTGRLAWTNGTTPPAINHAHHPEELLHSNPDPPDEEQEPPVTH